MCCASVLASIHHNQLNFCRDIADKAVIAKKLGLTGFLDDRLDVLGHMLPLPMETLLFMPSREEHGQHPLYWSPRIKKVQGWDALVQIIQPE
mmetsp:Transcript_60459/g.131233  ORF Transcript_60459/g.131233 Transcript_60459/m.131233 type:complete len:92 (+) Transcript_60459:95-370(+)